MVITKVMVWLELQRASKCSYVFPWGQYVQEPPTAVAEKLTPNGRSRTSSVAFLRKETQSTYDIHEYIQRHSQAFRFKDIYTCTYTYINTYTCVCVCTYVCTHTRMLMLACLQPLAQYYWLLQAVFAHYFDNIKGNFGG